MAFLAPILGAVGGAGAAGGAAAAGTGAATAGTAAATAGTAATTAGTAGAASAAGGAGASGAGGKMGGMMGGQGGMDSSKLMGLAKGNQTTLDLQSGMRPMQQQQSVVQPQQMDLLSLLRNGGR